MWSTKFASILIITCFFALTVVQILPNRSFAEDSHTRQLHGRTEISEGLPSKASYSSVEVFDADGDNLDELYLGGAGRGSVKTQGIHAFEYDTTNSKWKKFGSGLPDESSGKYYGALSFGDVNGDSNADLIAPLHTRWYGGNKKGIELYTGDGLGGFNLQHTIETGDSVSQAVVVDLDGDGHEDIAVSSNSAIRVWFGTGVVNTWEEKSPPKAGNEITGMDAGDLNNDGLLDLVGCPYFNSNAIRMYVQTSTRTWDEISFKKVQDEAFGIKITDFNADGNNDVIYGTRDDGIKAWMGNGGGANGGTDFQWEDGSAGLHDSGGHWQQLELQDLTGDGKPELIAGNNGEDQVFLYFNDQPNGWAWIFTGASGSDDPLLKEKGLVIGSETYGANFGDWDGDGEWDCAACSWGSGAKAWLINGTGTTGGAYPVGGETPPELPGRDEQVGIRLRYIILAAGALGLVLIIIIYLIFKRRKSEFKDQKKENKKLDQK